MAERTALLVAGGTGGHLFPAMALGAALEKRDWDVHYATDRRTESFLKDVPAARRHLVRSATLTANPLALARGLAELGIGTAGAARLVRRLRPSAVVGFGGYPTLPPLVSARALGIPILVHEQNAVLGRANRLLTRLGATLAASFSETTGAPAAAAHIGNPLRPAVLEAAATPYRPSAGSETFRLLVFGGSQGAAAFATLLPEALEHLSAEERERIHLVQQCRSDDVDAARARFEKLGVAAECATFFDDMPARIAAAHLVVSRAGASTVFELAAIGRPAILVPYPYALDHDQANNARALENAGGAWIVEQSALTPERLASELRSLMNDPERLARTAAASKEQGRPNAAEALADLVERTAEKRL